MERKLNNEQREDEKRQQQRESKSDSKQQKKEGNMKDKTQLSKDKNSKVEKMRQINTGRDKREEKYKSQTRRR